jgi:FkbM family methyltransferase
MPLRTLLKDAVSSLPGGMQRTIWRTRFRIGRAEAEADLLPGLVDPSRRALDIGASKGKYALLLQRLAREVVCFEPNPAVALRLRRLFSGRRSNVSVIHAALGDVTATLVLRVPRVGKREFDEMGSLASKFASDANATVLGQSVSGITAHEVPVCRLDDFGYDDVGFVKIDVEGYERQVIEGARQTLVRNRPNLLVEIEQRHNARPIGEIFELIAGLGYDGWFLLGGTLRPLHEFDVLALQNPAHADGHGPYVNNFVFTPRAG